MKKLKATESLPTRMTQLERPLIKRAAAASKLSESRFLVTAALLLADFETGDELRSALQIGYQLVNTRLAAVAQVRMVANHIKLLRQELEARSRVDPEKVERVLDEAAAAMKELGVRWCGRSAK